MIRNLLTLFLLVGFLSNAQVGIGTTNPAASTLLDVKAENRDKGILIPRVGIENLNTIAPLTGTVENGTLVFNDDATDNPIGFYYWDLTKWVLLSDANVPTDDTNLATTDLTQDAETRTYDMNGEDINFTNGSFGINKNNPRATLDVESNGNEDAFRFVQGNNLTGEKDVFTIEDQDIGGGGQDQSSVLKILKSGAINGGDNGFSLIELANTGTDPGNNKYWIAGHKVDEGAPLWGVDITDSDFWSTGGIQLGTTSDPNGTYTNGTFRVEANGNTGIGTITPSARLQIDEVSNSTDKIIVQINSQSGRPLNILQPDISDDTSSFTFQTNNSFNFRTDAIDAFTIKDDQQIALPEYDTRFFDNSPARMLAIDAAGNVVSSPVVVDSDADWYTSSTTNSPANIGDNIWTNGLVGIGTNNPVSSFHIQEATGNAGSAANGSITLEHNNSGGSSSIVFKSRVNNNSDYGYIRFEDDGSGNGNSSENALLTIGIENDVPGSFQDDINLNPGGYVGIKNNAPKRELHIAGNNSTIRIDGLNEPNNANNIAADPVPVYVNNAGDLVTQPSLIQSFMPINLNNFAGNGIAINSATGGATDAELNVSTITLTQPSLVHYSYQYSVTITRADGTALVDGASRLFRSWFTVNGDNNQPHAYDTGTYTNNPEVAGGTYASGFYYLSGSGYVELPAGTHTFRLFGRGFGGAFDFRMVFGSSPFESIQAVIHR